jgi:hypothetical protein
MTNPSKAKGTSWETEGVNYLNEVPLLGEAVRTGSADFGAADVHVGDWTFEFKAEREIDLPGYLKQLKTAVDRSGRYRTQSAVWVKNRRHSVGDAYVVMSGADYRALMVYLTMIERIATGALNPALMDEIKASPDA